MEPALQGKIREALLRDIRVLVPFVRAERIKRPNTQDADDGTEDIGLFII